MSPKSPYKKFFLLKPNTEIGSLPSVSFSVISALAYLGFQGLLPPYSQYTVHLSVCSTICIRHLSASSWCQARPCEASGLEALWSPISCGQNSNLLDLPWVLKGSWVQFSCSVVSDSLWPYESQHARPPCPSPTLGVHSDSLSSSQWCHLAISSSVVPFSSCLQSLPASESFPMSQLFAWGGQSTGVSALASFLPRKSQGWSLSEWTGWISLQSKGLSRVFPNTTVQKHQFFGAQLYNHVFIYLFIFILPYMQDSKRDTDV